MWTYSSLPRLRSGVKLLRHPQTGIVSRPCAVDVSRSNASSRFRALKKIEESLPSICLGPLTDLFSTLSI